MGSITIPLSKLKNNKKIFLESFWKWLKLYYRRGKVKLIQGQSIVIKTTIHRIDLILQEPRKDDNLRCNTQRQLYIWLKTHRRNLGTSIGPVTS